MAFLNCASDKPSLASVLMAMRTAYQQDSNPRKINFIAGAYRTNEGEPWVLPVVRKVELRMANDPTLDKEYQSLLGYEPFTSAATRMLLGTDSPSLKEGRATGIQCISGTGSLRIGAEYLATASNRSVVYISNETWRNHTDVFLAAGFTSCRSYRYWDGINRQLDFGGMLEDLSSAPENSVIVLHACAHNPTGLDPTQDQWRQISDLMEERKLLPFFDCAYIGFASGDVDYDSRAVRYFESRGFEILCAQSFSKNFGLYSERTGNLVFIAKDASSINPIREHCSSLVWSSYLVAPIHGARIVAIILNDPELLEEWKEQVKLMVDRVTRMRRLLVNHLEKLGTPGYWNHIRDGVGMFSLLGLNSLATGKLISDHHVYLWGTGRIVLCEITTNNVEYLAECIHDVVTTTQHEGV